MTRNETIASIKTALKQRSGKAWSVTGGRGTAWGWITIATPPGKRGDYGHIKDEDRVELAALLGLTNVDSQGVSIPSSSAYYAEFVARSAGVTPTTVGTPYWD